MSAEQELDEKIPLDAVLAAAESVLTESSWSFESETGTVTIPRDPKPEVVSRAFVLAHAPDAFLGDHYEAIVALGPRVVGENLVPTAGQLKLYFDSNGHFVSEDFYPPPVDLAR
jgi:hypothetical protein